MKKKKPKKFNAGKSIIGIGWYKESQWELLLKHAVDAKDIEPTYKEWLKVAHDGIENALSAGITCEKIPVDIQEMIDWCKDKSLLFNSKSRAEFIAMKTKEKFS